MRASATGTTAGAGDPNAGAASALRFEQPLRNGKGEPLRLLVVEDEALVALDLADIVTRMGATVVATTATEDDAMAAFERHRPDAVLMDVRLRRGDGIAASQRLRTAGPAPIVFVTASTDADTRRRMEAIAGAPIVSKPVRARDLRFAILAAIGAPDPRPTRAGEAKGSGGEPR